MFTGIIEGTGKLLERKSTGGGLVFRLEAGFELSDPVEGESIAVNGICLTAYDIEGSLFSVDVSPESVSRTTLGELSIGSLVNMERALRLSDRLGGHIVSGHIDCTARVDEIKNLGDFGRPSVSKKLNTTLGCWITRVRSLSSSEMLEILSKSIRFSNLVEFFYSTILANHILYVINKSFHQLF